MTVKHFKEGGDYVLRNELWKRRESALQRLIRAWQKRRQSEGLSEINNAIDELVITHVASQLESRIMVTILKS